ncbi:MAG: hypothetical protein JW892_02330 [Anaerolineae bacterium]|nr:hypothetical protein [Anaerolineae bacterium]
MPERIGFDRKLKRAWLDRTVEALLSAQEPEAAYAALHQMLRKEISAEVSRGKVITLLTGIWLRVPGELTHLRDEALSLWPELDLQERLVLHWGMALVRYPFFRDTVAQAGRLRRLQDTFTTAQLRHDVVARWGERAIVRLSAPRILLSLEEWGVVESVEARGVYRALPSHVLAHKALCLWLLEAALRSISTDALPLYDLLHLPELFPFDLQLSPGELHQSPRFVFLREGNNVELVALANGRLEKN